MFERGDQLLAPHGVTGGVAAAGAVLGFEAHQVGEQFVAAGEKPLALRCARRAIVGPTRSPDADAGDRQRERQRDPSRCHAVVRHIVEDQHDRLPGLHGAARGGDIGFALRRHVLLIRDLRRRQPRRAELLDDHAELVEARRQPLLHAQRAGQRRKVAPDLHERSSRSERTLDDDVCAGRGRLWR